MRHKLEEWGEEELVEEGCARVFCFMFQLCVCGAGYFNLTLVCQLR